MTKSRESPCDMSHDQCQTDRLTCWKPGRCVYAGPYHRVTSRVGGNQQEKSVIVECMATEKAGLLDQAEGNGHVPPPPYSDDQGAAPSSQQPPNYPSTGNTYQYYGGVTQQPVDPQHTTVIVAGPQPVCYLPPAPVLSKYPVGMECPSCHQQVLTKTEYVKGQLFWVSVLFLCVFGFWLALCFVPCCVKSVKDVRHSCPQCKAVLGTFQRLR